LQIQSYDRHGRHTSSGSGFLVNKTGLIVTNYHVVKNAYTVKVVLASDRHLVAVDGAAAFDEEADLAVLAVPFQFGAEPA
jgi:serine protease Do